MEQPQFLIQLGRLHQILQDFWDMQERILWMRVPKPANWNFVSLLFWRSKLGSSLVIILRVYLTLYTKMCGSLLRLLLLEVGKCKDLLMWLQFNGHVGLIHVDHYILESKVALYLVKQVCILVGCKS